MILFKSPGKIASYIHQSRDFLSVGFVPTMGALHPGHTSLVHQARNENELLIGSVFVNPTQFNDPKDFEKYPHTLEKDIYLMEQAACDVLFLPSVKDIYPDGIVLPLNHYPLGYLAEVLEGKYRPGHFQGVCQVVHRLLEIIKPNKMYLGQKDFQQCMVIKRLVEIIGMTSELVICPTSREQSGLAMSSRNMRLSPDQLGKAPAIYQSLNWIRDNFEAFNFNQLKSIATKKLEEKGFKVDYVEIADATDLRILQRQDKETLIVVLIAAYLNDVRLIDNIIIG